MVRWLDSKPSSRGSNPRRGAIFVRDAEVVEALVCKTSLTEFESLLSLQKFTEGWPSLAYGGGPENRRACDEQAPWVQILHLPPKLS